MIEFTVDWLGVYKRGMAKAGEDGKFLMDTVQIEGIEMNRSNKALFVLHIAGGKVKIH